MSKRPWALLLIVAGLLGCESLPHGTHAVHEHASSEDRAFVQYAASSNAYEIAAAELAQEKASSDKTKALAAAILKDHNEAAEHLPEVATELGFSLSSSLDAHDRAMLNDLSSKSGDEFDQSYLHHQIGAHEQAIARFEKQILEGHHTAARAFAQSHLPSLRAHLKMARELHAASTQPASK